MHSIPALRHASWLILALGVLGAQGCKKDEPPPPLPSASPVNTPPPPTAPIELVPEEPAPLPSASASAAPVKKSGSSSASLTKCCTALSQNAASAPEPNKTYMLQAAAICQAAVASGAPGALSRISNLLGGGTPAACK